MGGGSPNSMCGGQKGTEGFLSLRKHWCYSRGPQPYVLFSAGGMCDAMQCCCTGVIGLDSDGWLMEMLFLILIFIFMETGLCNSEGHKKIATYIRELILILDPVQRQDKTLHNSYVCIHNYCGMHKHRQ